MAFTRTALKSLGLSDEQIEDVMSMHGKHMADYVGRSQIEEEKKKAVEEALKNVPPADVKKDPEYIKLMAENKKLGQIYGEDFKGVKGKFREDVWNRLDHEKPVAEQMVKIKEDYPEYFVEEKKEEPEKKPEFGTGTAGAMPSGEKEKSFADYWGFNKKAKE